VLQKPQNAIDVKCELCLIIVNAPLTPTLKSLRMEKTSASFTTIDDSASISDLAFEAVTWRRCAEQLHAKT